MTGSVFIETLDVLCFGSQVKVYNLTQYEHWADDVLVMGTDGLWDVLSNQEVAEAVTTFLANCDPDDLHRSAAFPPIFSLTVFLLLLCFNSVHLKAAASSFPVNVNLQHCGVFFNRRCFPFKDKLHPWPRSSSPHNVHTF